MPQSRTTRAVARRRTPRQARSRDTVERVLDAAARVFGARGYAGTTNEIAASAGVSIGSLYQYFADKDAILVALAERHLADAARGLRPTLADEGGTADVRVRRLVVAAVEANLPGDLHEVLYATAPRTPALAAALGALRDEVAAAVRRLLIDVGVEPSRAAAAAPALVIAIEAAIHEHVLTAPTADDRARRVDHVVTIATGAVYALAGEDPRTGAPQA